MEGLNLHEPSFSKKIAEKLGIREIIPSDICPDTDALLKKYPDLGGDKTAIGLGDDGDCPSWKNYPGWWKSLVK